MCEVHNISTTEHIRNRVCRLCLGESKKLAHLENLFMNEVSFVDIIKDCFSLEIDFKQDHLPLLICKKCVTNTLNYHAFKNSIIENEVFLQCVNIDELNLKLSQNIKNCEIDLLSLTLKDYEPKERVQNYDSSSSSIDSVQNKRHTRRVHNEQYIYLKATQSMPASPKAALSLPSTNTSQSDVSSHAESGYVCSLCSTLNERGEKLQNVEKLFQKDTNEVNKTQDKMKIKAYKCSACNQCFETPGQWKKHMISHYEAKKYHCLHCPDSFDSKHELVAHSYTHLYKTK